jgi:hypothetical protein
MTGEKSPTVSVRRSETPVQRVKRQMRELEVQIDKQRNIVAEHGTCGQASERAIGLLRGMEALQENFQRDLNRLG